jgi:CBASS immunity sensor of nucleotide second messenger signals
MAQLATRRQKTNRRPKIPIATQLKLWVCSGGRCEVRGCNDYLLVDALTLSETNYSNIAHIVAASKDGPRGDSHVPLNERNHEQNLMLVCTKHHKLIDSQEHVSSWPPEVLTEHKREHEERIQWLTSFGPASKTKIIRLRCRIGGDPVQIPFDDIQRAVAPRYPADRQGLDIDLTNIRVSERLEYLAIASEEIEKSLSSLGDQGVSLDPPVHVSVFALAPIPLLIKLGNAVSNKIQMDVYQRHRSPVSWNWKTGGTPVQYKTILLKKGADSKRVGVLISLSGTIAHEHVPREIWDNCTIFELTLEGLTPSLTFLETKGGLDAFRVAYHSLLGQVQATVPTTTEIHLFPAVPAPVAVVCGHDLLGKAHPQLHVYDFSQSAGQFAFALTVNERSTK